MPRLSRLPMKCPICKKEFKQKKKLQKTCSKRCGDIKRKKFHAVICRRG